MAQAAMKNPIGRPRGAQAENTAQRRRQLLDAAARSIVEHGLAATTLATVARAAGLSPGVAVFYFTSKQNLLVETLRDHYQQYEAVWRRALAAAPAGDPLEQLMALTFADLDPVLCRRDTLALANSFWGEAGAQPWYAELCGAYDRDRFDVLVDRCAAAAPLMGAEVWPPAALAEALDSLTDGLWVRLHVTPGTTDLDSGRLMLARFLATVFPARRDRIMARVRPAAPPAGDRSPDSRSPDSRSPDSR